METPYHDAQPPSHGGGSRPSLGFPLGTALLLVVIFSLSGIFSCCYHWDRLRRSLSLRAADPEADGELGAAKPVTPPMNLQKKEKQSFPVVMPGDNVPKFIAMPCPRGLPPGKITPADAQMPPPRAVRLC